MLDLEGARMVAHRHPTTGGYAERVEVRRGQRLTAAAVALPALEVDELLQAASGAP